MRKLIPVEGNITEFALPLTMKTIHSLIKADTVDSFTLTDRMHVCIVDDIGIAKSLPMNVRATAMYWERCGGPNSHMIRGDVFVCPDSDFLTESGS